MCFGCVFVLDSLLNYLCSNIFELIFQNDEFQKQLKASKKDFITYAGQQLSWDIVKVEYISACVLTITLIFKYGYM